MHIQYNTNIHTIMFTVSVQNKSRLTLREKRILFGSDANQRPITGLVSILEHWPLPTHSQETVAS